MASSRGILDVSARGFLRSRAGNVATISAFLLPIALGTAALVLEYGNGLLQRAENQRVADVASFAAALAYGKAQSEFAMVAAATSVAALNGIPAGDVSVELVDSPKTSGAQAINVRIETSQPLFLAKIIDDRTSLAVVAESFAEFGAAAVPTSCILALDPAGTGLTLSGGTKVTANNCEISSNAAVSVPCGTKITTATLNYNSAAAPSQPCNGIVTSGGSPSTIVKKSTPDPLAGNASVTAAAARISTVSGLSAPTLPSIPNGGNIVFGWNQTQTTNQATAVGCTATWAGASSKWTLNCGSKPIINFGNITVGGGISVDFNLTSAATTVHNFSGSISNTGAVMRFGAGIYNVAKGITTGGGTTTTFKAGTYRIGRSNSQCGTARYSICNTSTLSFDGPSSFDLVAGFNNGGGATLTLGAGTANSFRIGPASNGNAIDLGGGAVTTMADATGGSSLFQIVGHVNGAGGGGCFVVSAASQHDIKGNFIASGAMILGAGVYTVDGYFALGANGGGSANCNGQTVSVQALGVTLVLSGKATPNGGSCSGQVFCVAAGYSNIQLTAPQTGATAKLAVIGPQSASFTGGAAFAEGGSNAQIAGAFYFPKGPISMNGGASAMGGGTGQCLQLIGTRITLAGGTAGASECIATAGSSGSSTVSLVQ